MYDRGAPPLFEKYGGGQWPSVVLPGAMNETLTFGGWGYGKIIVDERGIVRSTYDFRFEPIVNRMFLLEYSEASSQAESEKLGQYWYNGKSWRHYEDPTLSADAAATMVQRTLDRFSQAFVVIDGQKQAIEYLREEAHERGKLYEIGFGQGRSIRVLFSSHQLVEGDSVARAKLFQHAEAGSTKATLAGIGDMAVKYSNDGTIEFEGTVSPRNEPEESIRVTVRVNESAINLGTTKIVIEGEQATLSGGIGVSTYQQIRNLIHQHPNVKTLNLGDVEGRVNDELTRHMGRLLRQAQISTHIASNRRVTSGGADLFFAGVNRTIAEGGLLGTKSWSDGGFRGEEFPDDHPAHRSPQAYWQEMLGESAGRSFYAHVLESVSEQRPSFFKPTDCEKWGLVTQKDNL